jgi:hypothetical protein
MIILLCDHCGIDYSACGCLAGETDVLPVKPTPSVEDTDDFVLNPIRICLGCGEAVSDSDECPCVDVWKEEVV